jgi:ketosteroid isomerase-like protein
VWWERHDDPLGRLEHDPVGGYGLVVAIPVQERNSEVIRRYLRVFETLQVEELNELVDEDVAIHGAGHHVRGRHLVEGSVLTPGISNCRMRVDDFFAAGDRVTVAFTMTYTHDRTGRDLVMSGLKSYRLRDGRIVEFWGETDLYGLLRQAGLVPEKIPQL